MDLIHVTDHAILRWHERASAYGDEGERDVIAALRASRKIEDLGELPCPALPNTHYYLHEASSAVLGLQPTGRFEGKTAERPRRRTNHGRKGGQGCPLKSGNCTTAAIG